MDFIVTEIDRDAKVMTLRSATPADLRPGNVLYVADADDLHIDAIVSGPLDSSGTIRSRIEDDPAQD